MAVVARYVTTMATIPDRSDLDLAEQLVHIRSMGVEQDKRIAETRKLIQEIKLATPQMFFQGALAMAALIGAGAALAKLFG